MKKIGVFINCRDYPFIEAILRGDKRGETRTKDMLRQIFGPEEKVTVELIETGIGKAIVRGRAVFERGIKYNPAALDLFEPVLKIAYTKYDSGSDGKYVYWIQNPERCVEYYLPENVIRHGRSWCEWEV